MGRRLAGVLGDEFVIRTDDGEFRSPHPPRSPAAAAVLRRVADEIRAQRQEIERLRHGGATLEWRPWPSTCSAPVRNSSIVVINSVRESARRYS